MNVLRVILVDIARPHYHIEQAVKDLGELRSLVAAYGGIDVVHIIQHRTHPDKSTFIGSGKVQQVWQIVKDKKIDCIVINDIVNPGQLFNLTSSLWTANPVIQVWDRIDLILNIFDKHARTAESKLQIEIARLRHMGPRIFGMGGTYFSRQGAGIGTRGAGQSNIEVMKRHFRQEIKRKKDELAKLERHRQSQLKRRKDSGFKTLSLIGYTNAGKTTLFNALTGKNKLVHDAPFVTLDSAVGKIQNDMSPVIVSDTIGFIQNLPSHLLETFKSTLMEAIEADLLVQVVDISDDKFKEKMSVVEDILRQMGIADKKRLIVFNKTDKLNGSLLDKKTELGKDLNRYDAVYLSLRQYKGINELKKNINALTSSPTI